MKKKFLTVLFVALFLFQGVYALAAPRIFVDGTFVVSDVDPVIENDRTLVPLRIIAENLGYEVLWNEEEQKVYVEAKDKQLTLTIGGDYFIVRDRNKDETKYLSLDAPAKIINDRTFVPLRAIAEAFGEKVDWDAEERIVIVGRYSPKYQLAFINEDQLLGKYEAEHDDVKITYEFMTADYETRRSLAKSRRELYDNDFYIVGISLKGEDSFINGVAYGIHPKHSSDLYIRYFNPSDGNLLNQELPLLVKEEMTILKEGKILQSKDKEITWNKSEK